MNIGVVTGKLSGIVVVDEDSYKKNAEKIKNISQVVSLTGGGGKHYFYKYQEGITNKVFSDKGIDVRGEGGFIVLPPSLHKSGKRYQWESSIIDIVDIPYFLPKLTTEIEQKIGEIATEQLRPIDLVGLNEGSRNDSLHRLACILLNNNSEQDSFTMLEAVNRTFSPPLPENELREMFESARKFIVLNPLEKKNTGIKIYNSNEATKAYANFEKLYGQGFSTGFPELDWYFKLLPEELYLLSAVTHVGKTTLALNIASKIPSDKQVLFCSLEQGLKVIPRIKTITGQDKVADNILILTAEAIPTVEQVLQAVKHKKIDLLILDHLHYLSRLDKSATEAVHQAILELQVLAKRLKIPVIVICHLRKLLNEDKPPTMNDLKDTASLMQIPSVICLMYRKQKTLNDSLAGEGLFSKEGTVFVNKNRIGGKTGALKFILEDSGNISFI